MKKRNKTSAEFSMASLTDIIFLLLIFFMLTSKMVGIQPIDLPRSDSKTVAGTSVVVAIRDGGTFWVNDEETEPGATLERAVVQAVNEAREEAEDPEDLTITIAAETGTPFDYVVDVMQIAGKLRVKAIIATQPEQQ